DQKQIVQDGFPCQNDFIEVKMGGLYFRLHGLASSMDSVVYSFEAGFVIRQIARIFHESVSYCKCNVWDIYIGNIYFRRGYANN
ncbi:MAG: hypothetical protein OEM06_12260, partial [Desulfobacteraceae bacterium]|nr:hypothetical protein [Desulfobacteraceae bacterium]